MTLLHRLTVAAVVFAAAVATAPAAATEISLLSGGAVEPGLRPAIAAFEAATGHRVRITFNAAPQIAARLDAREAWDVVVGPLPVLDATARRDRTGAERVAVGRVGVGVAVRPGAPVPDIADEEALKRSVLAADSVVINRASTGVLVEALLRRLGIAAEIEPRLQRENDGAAVMEHLLKGQGREIGFGAITEILLFRDRGLRYVGPLPAAAQTYTTYAAAVPATTGHAEIARQLLAHLASPAARRTFDAAGIDPAP
jgi:molybdate transport system substrate-binding protein